MDSAKEFRTLRFVVPMWEMVGLDLCKNVVHENSSRGGARKVRKMEMEY